MPYTWCTCSKCLLHGPEGIQQTVRTERDHRKTDEKRPSRPLNLQSSLVITAPQPTSQTSPSQDASRDPNSPQPFPDINDSDDDFFESIETPQDQGVDEGFQWPVDADEGPCQNNEPSPPPEDDSDTEDIRADPLFRSRHSLFEAFQPGSDPLPHTDPSDEPWAFDDHPAIRNAYIHAFVGAAFHGMTHAAVANMLSGSHILLKSADANGTNYPGLQNFARTLGTVEKRLGVSTDTLITYFFACDICWKIHHPHTLSTLPSSVCDVPDCAGRLFSVKRLANKTEKRTPFLSIPFVSPETAIRRMCMQPGKVAQWQEWRGPLDDPGQREPSRLTGFEAFDDPNKPMHNVTDGWGWRAMQAGLERRRNGTWEIRDVDVTEVKQQFVALPNGLMVQINIDWFQAVKGGCHSTGALYMTLCNNPRSIQFLREETSLLLMFPGPNEPTTGQYNNIMKVVVNHFKRLYNGVLLPVHGEVEPALFHVQISSDVSDLPASRKSSGLLTFTSKYFMCDRCDVPFYALVDPDSFDSTKLNERDPWRYLKYSFRARDASEEVAEEIARRRGIRYSVMHELENWLPGVTGLLDLMHCIFGTLIKHLCKNILYKNGMIDSEGTKTIEEFFKMVIWPSSISRLPPSVARGAGSIKADQWRSQIAIFFIGLFLAWQVDGEIPDIDAPPSAANTKNAAAQASQEKLVRSRMREHLLAKNPDATADELDAIKSVTMDRSLRKHYDAIVQFTAAVRILATNSISPNEVKRGSAALERAIQSWARMHCHLVPYFHLAIHLQPQFLKHGPGPGWWTYSYERNNGFLGRFNHNGHSGGEIEGTMMRGWWKTTLIQDLISRLEAIPNPGPEDIDSLKTLQSYLKGGTTERRGTLQNYIATVQTDKNPNEIEFSRYPHNKILRQIGQGYYNRVFNYLHDLWSPEFKVVPDVSVAEEGEISFDGEVESFTHVWIQRQRYGAGEEHRGKSAQYAYIDCRIPVRIEHIYRAKQAVSADSSITTSFAIVRRFQPPQDVWNFPWDLWATDIGVHTWSGDSLGFQEIVALERFSGHFVLCPITVKNTDLWITVAYDHVHADSMFLKDGTEEDGEYEN
ncbi:hypothetical protein C8J57DRAFT_1610075 [Mycena rebaudengoi]|nr:hypothetical protein C8J57DRAFT_1610075 [Mycena rebaudengoi]